MRDFRLALRSLIKTPGFAVIAILAVALGIGASTTSFSIVNGVLLQPFPFIQSQDRLVYLTQYLALIAVSLLASYIPAVRATRADPMIALGHGA